MKCLVSVQPPAKELVDLAKYRSTEITDSAIQIAYLTAHGDWDRLPQILKRQMDTLNTLAGIVSQLLPIVPQTPAPA
jgi:hypothetical protein